MIAYILRRLASLAIVIVLVGVGVFALLHLAAGDPAAIIAGDNATPAQIAGIREKLGLDDPLPLQFYRWSTAVLSGDLGVSIFSNASVADMIGQRVGPTISLALTTLLFAVPIALLLGVLAAWRARSLVDRFSMVVSVAGSSEADSDSCTTGMSLSTCIVSAFRRPPAPAARRKTSRSARANSSARRMRSMSPRLPNVAVTRTKRGPAAAGTRVPPIGLR